MIWCIVMGTKADMNIIQRKSSILKRVKGPNGEFITKIDIDKSEMEKIKRSELNESSQPPEMIDEYLKGYHDGLNDIWELISGLIT